MRHIKWHQHYREKETPEETRQRLIDGCDDCKAKFDQTSSYCGHCWSIVRNDSYLSKNSRHIDGKCATRHRVKIPDRTVDKPPTYPWPEGFKKPLNQKFLKPWPFELFPWNYQKAS